MKRILVGTVIFLIGFVGGLYAFLKWIAKFPTVLHAFKLDLVEKFEYLLLGYNTHKGPRKTYYQPYYNRYRRTYRDYYGDKSFEDDETEEGDEE